MTPLHLAAMRGHADIAAKLLADGASPRVTDVHGLTAADWAERRGHVKLRASLLQAGDERRDEKRPPRV